MSEKQTVQERWQAFVADIIEVSKKHNLGGISVIGIVPEEVEEGKTSLPVYGASFFPRLDSATLLYSLRDQFLRILKETADNSIEAALKEVEESKKAPTTDAPAAEA